MRKIFFTIIGSTMISLGALHAQQQTDTTGTATESRTDQQQQPPDQTRQNRDQAWQQESDRYQNRDAYANEGMVIIDKDEIPSTLKETLKDEKYAGWENGTIYHNTNTGEYVIAPRAYRFDDQGQEIEANDTDDPANRSREGRYNSDQNGDEHAQPQDQGQMEQDSDNNNQTSPSQLPSDQYRNDQQTTPTDGQQPASDYRTRPDQGTDNSSPSQPGQSAPGQLEPGQQPGATPENNDQ